MQPNLKPRYLVREYCGRWGWQLDFHGFGVMLRKETGENEIEAEAEAEVRMQCC